MQNKGRHKPHALFYAFLLLALWGLLAFYALLPVLPDSPVTLPVSRSVLIQTLFPEGWKFYTANPREPRYLLFQRKDSQWVDASIGPNGRPSHYFGLNRKARAQGVEYGLLVTAIVKKNRWLACKDEATVCLERISVTDTLANISPRPTLCGIVGFVRQEMVPWAWREAASSLNMPSEVIKVRVIC